MCDGKDRVGKFVLVLPDHSVISGESLNLSGFGFFIRKPNPPDTLGFWEWVARAAAQLLDKEKGLQSLQRWGQRPRPVGMTVEPVTLKTTSHDHQVRGLTLRNHVLFWRPGASGRGFTSPLLSQPQFQGCSRQEEENRGTRAAGPTPALTGTKTSCSPRPEAVCLQTAAFALATVLCLPGQQRQSVCPPRPLPGSISGFHRGTQSVQIP